LANTLEKTGFKMGRLKTGSENKLFILKNLISNQNKLLVNKKELLRESMEEL
jgi:hypothetical protein